VSGVSVEPKWPRMRFAEGREKGAKEPTWNAGRRAAVEAKRTRGGGWIGRPQ